jgi:hypothetical protein
MANAVGQETDGVSVAGGVLLSRRRFLKLCATAGVAGLSLLGLAGCGGGQDGGGGEDGNGKKKKDDDGGGGGGGGY